MKYTNEYHGTPREHTWEELAERWMAATPGITEDDFAILMKRGAKQLGNLLEKMLGMHTFKLVSVGY